MRITKKKFKHFVVLHYRDIILCIFLRTAWMKSRRRMFICLDVVPVGVDVLVGDFVRAQDEILATCQDIDFVERPGICFAVQRVATVQLDQRKCFIIQKTFFEPITLKRGIFLIEKRWFTSYFKNVFVFSKNSKKGA